MASEAQKTESLMGMLLFHTSSVVTIASLLAERGDMIKEINEALNRSVLDSGSVMEHALWETVRDFFNPDIHRISQVVKRSVEGENIIPFPDDTA